MKNVLTFKRLMMYSIFLAMVVLTVISLLPGRTEPILDAEGNRIKSSITVMKKIKLGV